MGQHVSWVAHWLQVARKVRLPCGLGLPAKWSAVLQLFNLSLQHQPYLVLGLLKVCWHCQGCSPSGKLACRHNRLEAYHSSSSPCPFSVISQSHQQMMHCKMSSFNSHSRCLSRQQCNICPFLGPTHSCSCSVRPGSAEWTDTRHSRTCSPSSAALGTGGLTEHVSSSWLTQLSSWQQAKPSSRLRRIWRESASRFQAFSHKSKSRQWI